MKMKTIKSMLFGGMLLTATAPAEQARALSMPLAGSPSEFWMDMAQARRLSPAPLFSTMGGPFGGFGQPAAGPGMNPFTQPRQDYIDEGIMPPAVPRSGLSQPSPPPTGPGMMPGFFPGQEAAPSMFATPSDRITQVPDRLPSGDFTMQGRAPPALPGGVLGVPGAAMGVPMTPRQQGTVGRAPGYGPYQGGYDPAMRSAAIRGLAGRQFARPLTPGTPGANVSQTMQPMMSLDDAMAQIMGQTPGANGSLQPMMSHQAMAQIMAQTPDLSRKQALPLAMQFMQNQNTQAMQYNQWALANSGLMPYSQARQLASMGSPSLKGWALDQAALQLQAQQAVLPQMGAGDNCPYGTYQATSGDCVERPDYSSRNVTALCRDGTYSHSESHQGACSHHGGVWEFER
jgi:hypothetical protein